MDQGHQAPRLDRMLRGVEPAAHETEIASFAGLAVGPGGRQEGSGIGVAIQGPHGDVSRVEETITARGDAAADVAAVLDGNPSIP